MGVYGISLANNIKGNNSFLLTDFLFDCLWCLGGVFSHDHYSIMLFNFFLFAYAYILRNFYNSPYQKVVTANYQKVVTASYQKILRAKSGGLLQETINFTHNRTVGYMNSLWLSHHAQELYLIKSENILTWREKIGMKFHI